ncbi:MAG: EAL domain-containing protein [Gammaproteobacteria bacterium]|nr:EAL domain-containing protein [Gammaproteobacteria bacterium]
MQGVQKNGSNIYLVSDDLQPSGTISCFLEQRSIAHIPCTTANIFNIIKNESNAAFFLFDFDNISLSSHDTSLLKIDKKQNTTYIGISSNTNIQNRVDKLRLGCSILLNLYSELVLLSDIIKHYAHYNPASPGGILFITSKASKHTELVKALEAQQISVTETSSLESIETELNTNVPGLILLGSPLSDISFSELISILSQMPSYSCTHFAALPDNNSQCELIRSTNLTLLSTPTNGLSPTQHFSSQISRLITTDRYSNISLPNLKKVLLRYNSMSEALNSHSIVSITDVAGNITFVNNKFCEISGYSREELIGNNHRIVKSGLHPDEFYKEMWHTILNGKTWHGIICNLGKSGKPYWVESSIIPMLDSNQQTYQYISVRTDITQIKLAEEELLKQKRAMDNAQDGMCIINYEGHFTYLNNAFANIYEHDTTESLLNKHWNELYSHNELQYFKDEIFPAIKNYKGWSGEIIGKSKNGDEFVHSLSLSVLDDRSIICSVCDITTQKENERNIRINEDRLRRSQVYANIGTWDWDIQTGTLSWSEQIGPLFGYQTEILETTYDNFLAAIHPGDRQNVINAVAACIENRDEYNIEYRVVWPDGTIRYLLERGDVKRDKNGAPTNMLGVVQDITKRVELTKELISAKEDAEKANAAKTEFLSNMSHELRTPLNAIMGFSQLFTLDNKLAPDLRENGEEIYIAGKHLLELINEVLDLAKIETGNIELSLEQVPITKLLGECNTLSQPFAKQNNIQLQITPYITDTFVFADYMRLKQVILNLISNAIKYNSINGSVSVTCTQPNSEKFRINISDTGQGISDSQKENLFQPFNRLGAENSGVEGTGIGLVITKRLVDLMNGTIGVDSNVNSGSTFWIDIPCKSDTKQHEGSLTLKPNKKEKSAFFGKKVLVAEDNPVNQKLILQQLKTIGLSSQIASNGIEAFELWQKNKYDLLLTDCHMPEMDGYQLTKKIRLEEEASNENHRTPIVALTANALKEDEEKCILIGMDDYIAKPVKLNHLKKIIQQWLQIQTNPISDNNIYIDTSNQKSLPIDINILREQVGEQPEIWKQIIDSFISNTPELVTELKTALQNNDLNAVSFVAHKIKSGARSIGANKLTEITQSIESFGKLEQKSAILELQPALDRAISEVISYTQSNEIISQKEPPADLLSGAHILTVDDDKFTLTQLGMVLGTLGIHKVTKATSGEMGLDILKSKKNTFGAVICDLNMPGIDGIEFLRHLAALNYKGGVVLISGEDKRVLKTVGDLAKAHKLNMLGALEKPVTQADLHQVLNKLQEVTPKAFRSESSVLTADDLANGIRNDELIVYFQPQIDVKTKQFIAVEALVRWQHPEKGMIPPDNFISIAEKNGLIDLLTDAVLEKSIHQKMLWQAQGVDLQLSVNFSLSSLNRLELPEKLAVQIESQGMEASQLICEVTESGLMQDMTISLEVLTRLRLKGIGLSIDDFGTGYSTMEQLQRIPFTELKIDRAFVNDAGKNNDARAILESSVALAKKLNLKIIAEGVENQEDWDLIEKLECDVIQGYFVSKPMPGDEIINWKQNWDKTLN